jgi:hypothetical protein
VAPPVISSLVDLVEVALSALSWLLAGVDAAGASDRHVSGAVLRDALKYDAVAA